MHASAPLYVCINKDGCMHFFMPLALTGQLAYTWTIHLILCHARGLSIKFGYVCTWHANLKKKKKFSAFYGHCKLCMTIHIFFMKWVLMLDQSQPKRKIIIMELMPMEPICTIGVTSTCRTPFAIERWLRFYYFHMLAFIFIYFLYLLIFKN